MISKRWVLFFLAALFIIPQTLSCSPAKDIEERRNYMIPKKSDLPANSRYRESEKRKTYKYKARKPRQKSYF